MLEDRKASTNDRKQPRRRFSVEHKRGVVRALLRSPLSLACFAREHALNHNQLARWRREYEQGLYGEYEEQAVAFMPVCVEAPVSAMETSAPECPAQSAAMTIELHLPKGKVVLRDVGPERLKDVLEALQ